MHSILGWFCGCGWQVEAIIRQVTIFGCDNVSSKTSVIYDPMRMVTTGVAGVQTMKGSIALNQAPLSADEYTEQDMAKTVENGAASFPSTLLYDFDRCFTCLLYAKGTKDDHYLRAKDDEVLSGCQDCYKRFCWRP